MAIIHMARNKYLRLPHTRDSMITNIKMLRWNPTRVTKYKFNKNPSTYNTYKL